MTISSNQELVGLRHAGRVVAEVLAEVGAAVEPGITTRELDALCAAGLQQRGAESAPARDYGFPGAMCISINDEAVHGVPSERRVEAGDLVKLDLVAVKQGFYADAARSIVVPPQAPELRRLASAARLAFMAATRVIRSGAPLRKVGRAVEQAARRAGVSVIPELAGHGVGAAIHEAPTVPNAADPTVHGRLHEGLVIAVEPILTNGSGRLAPEDEDGWTLRTRDGGWVSHHENTLVVTRGKPIVLTTLAA